MGRLDVVKKVWNEKINMNKQSKRNATEVTATFCDDARSYT